jgi:hypothetical protein
LEKIIYLYAVIMCGAELANVYKYFVKFM